ncbi:hypothetical protein AB0E27_32105 [Streptomyces sparsogenes]
MSGPLRGRAIPACGRVPLGGDELAAADDGDRLPADTTMRWTTARQG